MMVLMLQVFGTLVDGKSVVKRWIWIVDVVALRTVVPVLVQWGGLYGFGMYVVVPVEESALEMCTSGDRIGVST